MASVSRSPVRGSCGRYPTAPERRTEPPAGWAWPASTLASVVFPAPLRPTRPMRSPAATWKDAPSSSRRAPARSSMSVATIMIQLLLRTNENGQTSPLEGVLSPLSAARHLVYLVGRRRANGFRLGQADANGQEGARCLLQHGQPRVGDGEEAVGGQGQVRRQPRVAADPRDGPLVPAQDQSVQAVRAEDRDRGLGGGPHRGRGLVLPAPGEAVLRPAARRAPAGPRPAPGRRAHRAPRRAGAG